MSIQDEINNGIGAHGMWKQRILSAIETGESDWTPELVLKDDQCEFGKWLHSCSPQDKSSEHYSHVKKIHTNFHKIASSVLGLAIQGKRAEAEAALDMEGDYRSISAALTSEMMAWKREAATECVDC